MKAKSPKLLIFLTVFIDLIGFGIVIPIASLIAKKYLDQGKEGGEYWPVLVGLLMASYSLCQMLFAPFWGSLSDRVGRRPVILLSLAGSAASYAIFAFAGSYPMLLAARVLAGVCGANLGVAHAYMADVTDEKERAGAMGLLGMAFGLGFVLGPVIGGLALYVHDHFQLTVAPQFLPGAVASGICLLNFIWASRALPESHPPERRGKGLTHRRNATLRQVASSLGHPVVGPLAGVFFMTTLAFVNLEVGLGLYIESLGHPPKAVYKFFIYIGLLLAFMQGYVVRKAAKFVPEPILVIAGLFAQAVGLAVLPFHPSDGFVYLGLAFVAFGQGIATPSLMALVSKAAGADERGGTLGVTQSASSLARVAGPMLTSGVIVLGNRLAEGTGIRFPFWSGAFLMIVAAGLAIVTRERLLRRPLPDPGEPAA